MVSIEEYIALSKAHRQKHLRLSEPCLIRGGFSTECKVLLAHLHGTTVPKGRKIQVCHACHNADCTNPNHLYWGTSSENKLDEIENSGMTFWDRIVAKHGEEGARAIQRHKNQAAAGRGNKGKPKSEAHRKAIAEGLKKRYAPVGELV